MLHLRFKETVMFSVYTRDKRHLSKCFIRPRKANVRTRRTALTLMAWCRLTSLQTDLERKKYIGRVKRMRPYYCIYHFPMSSCVRNSAYKEPEIQLTRGSDHTTENNLSNRTHKTKLHLNTFYFRLNKSVVTNI